ncbi:MAG: type I methionyl aminopeptidase [Deltaproteobacteria bacterium]|nr:type I methionyl aminopeptidase [Deltaproteobacteria bacterium]
MNRPDSPSDIDIKSSDEIAALRASCRLAADVLVMIEPHVRPGISTGEIDRLCHEYIVAHGAYPSPLGYRGFPKATCTSINEVVCHGIPSFERVLKDGDIINVDITTLLGGFHGDTSKTFCVGQPSAAARALVDLTRDCLDQGVAAVRPGGRIGDIGAAIQAVAESHGCSVVRDFVGHGIGREFHAPPEVPHFGRAGRGVRLRPGMTFTIEPMINAGDWRIEILDDNWTAITRDRSLSAQFEHTVLVTQGGAEVLTIPSGR